MDSLFDQLKSEAAVNKHVNEPPPSPPRPLLTPSPVLRTPSPVERSPSPALREPSPALREPSPAVGSRSPAACSSSPPVGSPPAAARKEDAFSKRLSSPEPKTVTSPRRESMPPPRSATVIKKNNKCRSLSPPKAPADKLTKSLKVLVERKKLNVTPLTSKASTQNKSVKSKIPASKLAKNGEKSLRKLTPTKAQQKLFDPAVLKKAQQLKQLKVKRCVVRVQRQNLKQLQRRMFTSTKAKPGPTKQAKKGQQATPSSPNKSATKRKADNSSSSLDSLASPSKRAKKNSKKDEKRNSSFFIKLSTVRDDSPVEKKSSTYKKLIKVQQTKKQKQQKLSATTKPTKFTRTQLIKTYGKRFFHAHVKIERCSHPMMLIFESNARARRLQTKRNKSKNLSVSFREQVEIFGGSSDSEASLSDLDADASTSKAAKSKATPLLVTPARLKKVENGKVVDDIELDPSLFVVSPGIVSSTPFPPSGRKKREKKSYSPLKGDGTPSPRKERLKLANEKMPPSGLRRLTVDDADDDDDEDDECEYIVPIDIPARRTSRASSVNAVDEDDEDVEETATQKEASSRTDARAAAKQTNSKNTTADSTAESFVSAEEQPATSPSKENNKAIDEDEQKSIKDIDHASSGDAEKDAVEGRTKEVPQAASDLAKLTQAGSLSPAQSLNSLTDLVDSIINNNGQDKPSQLNDSVAVPANNSNEIEGLQNVPVSLSDDVSKLRDTLDDNISLELFVDEDPDNMTNNSPFTSDSVIKDSEIVNGIINERIDELSKEKRVSRSATPPHKIAAE